MTQQRRLGLHLIAYVIVNAMVVGIWFLTSPEALFWPGVPLMGWSVGLLFHIWTVYPPTRPGRRAARRPHRPRTS